MLKFCVNYLSSPIWYTACSGFIISEETEKIAYLVSYDRVQNSICKKEEEKAFDLSITSSSFSFLVFTSDVDNVI